MNPSGARPPPYGLVGRPSAARAPGTRILGDQRREAADAAAAVARANKRRLLRGGDDVDDDDDDAGYNAFADGSGLFADEEYDEEDREADAIYASVEKRMDANRAAERDARVEAELKKYREENPTIKQQFAESKQALSKVSLDEWAAIPDIGDYSVKKRKIEKFTPAPDSLLDSARQQLSSTNTVQGTVTDLAAIGKGRASVLGHNLDQAGKSGRLSSRPAVDATGYLTEMAGVHISSASEISDIKRARLLLKSVTTTNPNHAPGWIAAARLEEVAGRMSAARDLAGEGCRRCPGEEDVWLEAARLYPSQRARRVLAQAVIHVPRSVKVWLQASALEHELKRKKRVLQKALEIIPRSARLWRAAVDLEETNDARQLLHQAVKNVPDDAELWLALAKLEPYEQAKSVLSRARAALPTEPSIWVTAARLEEQFRGGDSPLINELLRNAVNSLSVKTEVVKRERWIEEAQEADKTGFRATCYAIVEAALGLGIHEADRLDVWSEDADEAERQGFVVLARAIHLKITSSFPAQENLWIRSAQFEKRSGSSELMQKVLANALEYCAQVEILWLMLAKEQWVNSDVDTARKTLEKALRANSDEEAIWIAAAKVETESGEYERARYLLRRAREEAPSARVVMKSALLERLVKNHAAEVSFLDEGVQDFPKENKLWLMLTQWHERNKQPLTKRFIEEEGDTNGFANGFHAKSGEIKSVFLNPREVYQKGVRTVPHCIPLWIGFARFEERTTSAVAARAVLERGRQANKNVEDIDLLWRESVYLEVRMGGGTIVRAGAAAPGGDTAQTLLSRALRECPTSGKLWALAMALAPTAERKARTGDALRECGRDPLVILEAGRLLWRDGKIAKARKWFARSVDLDTDCGDTWGALLAFERVHGTEESILDVEERAKKAEPSHGDLWCTVRKSIGNEKLSVVEVVRRVATLTSSEANITGMFHMTL